MGQPQYGLTYPKSLKDQPTPLTPLFKSKDGDWILIANSTWDITCPGIFKMLRLEQYSNDERYTVLENARERLAEIVSILQNEFGQMSTEDIISGLRKLDVVHMKLINPAEVSKDEQAWANGYLKKIRLENGEDVVLPSTPIQFGSLEELEFNLAPHLGADSIEILSALGYDEVTIAELLREQTIK